MFYKNIYTFIGVTFLVLCFLLSYFGEYFWLFDLFSYVRLYFGLGFLALYIVALREKNRNFGVLFFVLVFIIFLEIFPLYTTVIPSDKGQKVKLMSVNLGSENNKYKKFKTILTKENPDILFLQEFTPKWEENLRELEFIYRVSYKNVLKGEKGLGFFTSLPIEDIKDTIFDVKYPEDKFIIVELRTNKKEKLNLIAFKTPFPSTPEKFFMRNYYFKHLKNLINSKKEERYILVGDMGISGFSTSFKSFLSETNLKDSRKGFGFNFSWHAKIGVLGIDLDHCLISDGIKVNKRKLLPIIGSDHFPILTHLSL